MRDRPRSMAGDRVALAILSIVAALSATSVHACTLCHSRIADDVRAAVFGPGFWSDVAMLASPIPVLAAAVIAVGRLLP